MLGRGRAGHCSMTSGPCTGAVQGYHADMIDRFTPTQLLRFAGLLTWATIGMPLLLLGRTQPADAADGEVLQPVAVMGFEPWLVWVMAGASYAWLTQALGVRKTRWTDYVLLAVLVASAISLSHFTASGLGSLLLMVTACVLPWLLPLPLGVAVLAISELVIVPVYMRVMGMSLIESLMQAMVYFGVTGFVFATSLVARQQAHAREEQRRLNAELRATRALLAESVRVNERTRIARELHDLLGHHLTALSMNLEVAGHLTQGTAQEHVGQAHTLAKLLLSDVREAVSQLRDSDAIDLAASLRLLAGNVPNLDITITVPDRFTLDDAELAHVILRCTQEIITNTIRHAHAGSLRLQYSRDEGGIGLQARDDGRGSAAAPSGNGLQGMRERVQARGGQMSIDTSPGGGFGLSLWFPHAPPRSAGLPSAPPSRPVGQEALP